MSSRRRSDTSALDAALSGQQPPQSGTTGHFSSFLKQAETIDPVLAKQMVSLSDGTIQINDFLISPLGLLGGEQASIEEWDKIGKMLFRFHDSLQIIIGDWLGRIERVHGKTYEQVADELGRRPKTLRNWKNVMASVDMSLRRDNLTYKHYVIVAPMDYEKQAKWLELASVNKWGANKMQDEIDNEDPPPLREPTILRYSPDVLNTKDIFFARVERISRAFDGKDNPDQQDMREYIKDIEKFVKAIRENFGWTD